ncbi:MAG: CHAD domain-containing protein, partial [Myxococcales bacterium]|nr:CHAD domain-containing protein [Myxococcales bacterium]
DIHGFRRRVRRLRYQLELLASTKAGDVGSDAPAWLDDAKALHKTMKGLASQFGAISDLLALRDLVSDAKDEEAGFDRKRLRKVLNGQLKAEIERALVEAARAFESSPKKLLVAAVEATEEAASTAATKVPDTPEQDDRSAHGAAPEQGEGAGTSTSSLPEDGAKQGQAAAKSSVGPEEAAKPLANAQAPEDA